MIYTQVYTIIVATCYLIKYSYVTLACCERNPVVRYHKKRNAAYKKFIIVLNKWFNLRRVYNR